LALVAVSPLCAESREAKIDKAAAKELLRVQRLADEGDNYWAYWLEKQYDPEPNRPPVARPTNYNPKKSRYVGPMTRSFRDAVYWYTKAAKRGHGEAQSRLGDIYFDGKLDAVYYYDAADWYGRSSVNKSNERRFGDMNRLAWMHENGKGVEQSDEIARKLYKLAADANNPTAENNMGLSMEYGRIGYSIDLYAAATWYRASSNHGYNEANERLASVTSRLNPQQSAQFAEYERGIEVAAAQRRQQEATEQAAAATEQAAAEADPPVPSTLAIVLGQAGQTIGQISRQRAENRAVVGEIQRQQQQQAAQQQAQQQAALEARLAAERAA
jgi:TPR repeat protein